MTPDHAATLLQIEFALADAAIRGDNMPPMRNDRLSSTDGAMPDDATLADNAPASLEALAAAARRGDREAAHTLVERLYPRVLRIARFHRPRAEAEEDLAQEVFLKLFARLHQYRGDCPFEHWVSRITVSTCLDRLRRQKARPELRLADLSPDQARLFNETLHSQCQPDAVDAYAARELAERLLALLEPRDQLILTWLDLEGATIHEIADRTGWGESFIKMRAHRARRKLRAKALELNQTPRP